MPSLLDFFKRPILEKGKRKIPGVFSVTVFEKSINGTVKDFLSIVSVNGIRHNDDTVYRVLGIYAVTGIVFFSAVG